MQCHVQPREIAVPRDVKVQEEIQNYLEALDSYPARVAKEPGITFQQHLSRIATSQDLRTGARTRR